MSKYDKMLEENKKKSAEMVGAARVAIHELQMVGERVSVPKLMKKTGLSRGFFYKNPEIRADLDRAIEQQAGVVDPRREILSKAMDSKIEMLMKQNAELKNKKLALEKENERLRKALNKKELNILKNL